MSERQEAQCTIIYVKGLAMTTGLLMINDLLDCTLTKNKEHPCFAFLLFEHGELPVST